MGRTDQNRCEMWAESNLVQTLNRRRNPVDLFWTSDTSVALLIFPGTDCMLRVLFVWHLVRVWHDGFSLIKSSLFKLKYRKSLYGIEICWLLPCKVKNILFLILVGINMCLKANWDELYNSIMDKRKQTRFLWSITVFG